MPPIPTPTPTPPPSIHRVNGSYKAGSFTRASRGGSLRSRSRSTTPSGEVSSGDDHTLTGPPDDATNEDGVQLRRRRRRRHTTSDHGDGGRPRPASMHETEQLRQEHNASSTQQARPRSGSDGTSEKLKGLISQFSKLSTQPGGGAQRHSSAELGAAGKSHPLASASQVAGQAAMAASRTKSAPVSPNTRRRLADSDAADLGAAGNGKGGDDSTSSHHLAAPDAPPHESSAADADEAPGPLVNVTSPSMSTVAAAAEVSGTPSSGATAAQPGLPRQRSADAILRSSASQTHLLTSGSTAQERRTRLPMPPRGFRKGGASHPSAGTAAEDGESRGDPQLAPSASGSTSSTREEPVAAAEKGAATFEPGAPLPEEPSESAGAPRETQILERRLKDLEERLDALLPAVRFGTGGGAETRAASVAHSRFPLADLFYLSAVLFSLLSIFNFVSAGAAGGPCVWGDCRQGQRVEQRGCGAISRNGGARRIRGAL